MSNKPTTGPPPPPTFGPNEAAQAINEQGFLLQLLLREKIQNRIDLDHAKQLGWFYVQAEYPVTAFDGTQTRIDLVLRHQLNRCPGLHLCLECKRPNPNYKFWLFFDRIETPDRGQQYFLECVWNDSDDPGRMVHQIAQVSHVGATPAPAFNCYLEAAIKKGRDTVSSTNTIEGAFRQLIAGTSGLMQKLKTFVNQQRPLRVIPVVATTASLKEVKLSVNDISLKDGTIEPAKIQLSDLEWCTVDYHADDSLSLHPWLPPHDKGDIETDLRVFQTRTVFVVQASSLNKFLTWAGGALISL